VTDSFDSPGLVRVVFVDANVLYSRVLRDYLLYAADEEIIAIAWSPEVLDEVTEHLVANLRGFTAESGVRLVKAMNRAFPDAETQATSGHDQKMAGIPLPDEDDRHVLAAAIAAEATVLCTANVKDFPDEVVLPLGIEVMSPDHLLPVLIAEYPSSTIAVHATVVAKLRGATDASTLAALQRSGAPTTAARMARLLEQSREAQD
jgi:predicted nucleic acid-binding protein